MVWGPTDSDVGVDNCCGWFNATVIVCCCAIERGMGWISWEGFTLNIGLRDTVLSCAAGPLAGELRACTGALTATVLLAGMQKPGGRETIVPDVPVLSRLVSVETVVDPATEPAITDDIAGPGTGFMFTGISVKIQLFQDS